MGIQAKLPKLESALKELEGQGTACRLCPRRCAVDRGKGKTGFCRTGSTASVSHVLLHFGEEPVLSGPNPCGLENPAAAQERHGSGAVFFSGCSLKCLFCQNHQISWQEAGAKISDYALAQAMLDLQEQGAANINLVSPTHVLLPILRALHIAFSRGLRLPIVYNSHGYESAAVLRNLEGIIDIYLPDSKYSSSCISEKLSQAADYSQAAGGALIEMFCQQPVLEIDHLGLAQRGLIVRHLILPGQTDDSLAILDWLRRHLAPSIGLSLMSQYSPCFLAPEDLRRTITPREYQRVLDHALDLGFENLFLQPEPFKPGEHLLPDFARDEPFVWHKT
jgi:putative pyruvate formate lyase activating enzyme